MLDEQEIAIHFQRKSLHYNVSYQVIRIRNESEGKVTMSLTDAEVLYLFVGQANCFEVTALVHFRDFAVLKSHGVPDVIHLVQVKNNL